MMISQAYNWMQILVMIKAVLDDANEKQMMMVDSLVKMLADEVGGLVVP